MPPTHPLPRGAVPTSAGPALAKTGANDGTGGITRRLGMPALPMGAEPRSQLPTAPPAGCENGGRKLSGDQAGPGTAPGAPIQAPPADTAPIHPASQVARQSLACFSCTSRISSAMRRSFSSRSFAIAPSRFNRSKFSSASCRLRSLASASLRLRSASSLFALSSFRFFRLSSRSFCISSSCSRASSAASCSRCSRSRCRHSSSSRSFRSSASLLRCSKASWTFRCSASTSSLRRRSSRKRSCSLRFCSSSRRFSRSCSASRSSSVILLSICHHSGVLDLDLSDVRREVGDLGCETRAWT
mmetsp:Transcript_57671/g.134339  ORF Transcript_57671/g.134339 Transcript_57671/m.134339 type:complete len:300 (+) Transcript_57671:220-1119(+)